MVVQKVVKATLAISNIVGERVWMRATTRVYVLHARERASGDLEFPGVRKS